MQPGRKEVPMKKLLKIIIPAVLMFILVYLLRGGKNILDGLYIIFPLMYVVMGIIYSDFVKELLWGTLLTSIFFIIPINIWYHMGSCLDLACVYFLLSCITYFIKKTIKKKLLCKKH